jgi:hypothetical protein
VTGPRSRGCIQSSTLDIAAMIRPSGTCGARGADGRFSSGMVTAGGVVYHSRCLRKRRWLVRTFLLRAELAESRDAAAAMAAGDDASRENKGGVGNLQFLQVAWIRAQSGADRCRSPATSALPLEPAFEGVIGHALDLGAVQPRDFSWGFVRHQLRHRSLAFLGF